MRHKGATPFSQATKEMFFFLIAGHFSSLGTYEKHNNTFQIILFQIKRH